MSNWSPTFGGRPPRCHHRDPPHHPPPIDTPILASMCIFLHIHYTPPFLLQHEQPGAALSLSSAISTPFAPFVSPSSSFILALASNQVRRLQPRKPLPSRPSIVRTHCRIRLFVPKRYVNRIFVPLSPTRCFNKARKTKSKAARRQEACAKACVPPKTPTRMCPFSLHDKPHSTPRCRRRKIRPRVNMPEAKFSRQVLA